MKAKWNKAAGYSWKTIGIVFLILVIFITLYFVLQYKKAPSLNSEVVPYNNKDSNVKQISTSTKLEVISLVRNIPDVKEWLKLFRGKNGYNSESDSYAKIEVEGTDGDFYIVHAYEDYTDRTATFNWYYVNLETKEIQVEVLHM